MDIKNRIVKGIMTLDVVSVTEEMAISDVFEIMRKHDFSGLPVINNNSEKKFLGLVTDYDLISKRTSIHIPTFERLFTDFYIVDRHGPTYSELKHSSMFRVKDIMNKDALKIDEEMPMDNVVELFSKHHRVNPIPVVNADGVLVGIVSRYDVIKLYASILQVKKE